MIHPYNGWVQYAEAVQPGFFEMYCTICDSAMTGSAEDVDAFAAAHTEHRSANPEYYGMGDAVAAFTKMLGIETCTPCEQRRLEMNELVPTFWRR